jgi:hypothetical protein
MTSASKWIFAMPVSQAYQGDRVTAWRIQSANDPGRDGSGSAGRSALHSANRAVADLRTGNTPGLGYLGDSSIEQRRKCPCVPGSLKQNVCLTWELVNGSVNATSPFTYNVIMLTW